MNTHKVWFVTGASKGLGFSLIQQLVKSGYRVAATSRTVGSFSKELPPSENFLPLAMEVVNEKSVKQAISKTIETFGHIDVVVNNAGYGQLGTLEELTDHESRENFDVNVFGVLNVMRSVMPHFRQRGTGHVINISSIAGFLGAFPGWGIYNATKFAVAGLTEAFSAETKIYGHKVYYCVSRLLQNKFPPPGIVTHSR